MSLLLLLTGAGSSPAVPVDPDSLPDAVTYEIDSRVTYILDARVRYEPNNRRGYTP